MSQRLSYRSLTHSVLSPAAEHVPFHDVVLQLSKRLRRAALSGGVVPADGWWVCLSGCLRSVGFVMGKLARVPEIGWVVIGKLARCL